MCICLCLPHSDLSKLEEVPEQQVQTLLAQVDPLGQSTSGLQYPPIFPFSGTETKANKNPGLVH